MVYKVRWRTNREEKCLRPIGFVRRGVKDSLTTPSADAEWLAELCG